MTAGIAGVALVPVAAMAQSATGTSVERTGDSKEAEDETTKSAEILVVGRSNPVSTVERAERYQARQVRDIFVGDPSVDIAGGSRNGQRLFLRGIEGSNLNITIDGARQGQNLYNHRGGLSNIDPEMLKRVEIQAGPSAADQGYGALGGAIRFETVDAQDVLRSGGSIGGFVRGGYASAAETRRLALGAYGLLTEEIGLLVYATGSNYDDIRIGDGGEIPFSGGKDRSLLVKLSVVEAGPHSLRVGFEHNKATGLNFQQRGDYPYQLQPIDLTTRPPQDQSLTRDTWTGRYRFNPESELIDLRVDAYNSRNDFFAPNNNGERFISDVTGGDIRNILVFPFAGGRLETSVGGDYVVDRGTANHSTQGTRYNRNSNLGLFLQNRLYLGMATLYAGVRRDDFKSDYGPRTAKGDAWSFNIGGELSPVEQVTLFAGYGEAAKGTGTLPIHFARNVQPGVTFNGLAAGELDPERSKQLEGGARVAFNDIGASGIGVRANITLFRTEIDDAILYFHGGSGGLGGRPITNIYNYANTIKFDGFEASVEVGTASWSTALRYSEVDIKDMPSDPQFIARTGAPRGDQFVWESRASLGHGVNLGYTLRRTGRLKDVPAGQIVYVPKPGFTLHDIQASWEPQGVEGLALEFSVTNLTDKRYVAHSTLTQNGLATEEAGRDIRLSLRYRY